MLAGTGNVRQAPTESTVLRDARRATSASRGRGRSATGTEGRETRAQVDILGKLFTGVKAEFGRCRRRATIFTESANYA